MLLLLSVNLISFEELDDLCKLLSLVSSKNGWLEFRFNKERLKRFVLEPIEGSSDDWFIMLAFV